jgi:predicted TIM-barrel enzyme
MTLGTRCSELSGARPLGTNPATDEVIDVIADIEVQRRAMEKEAGLAAASSSALRKLHELLDREKEALQLRGPATGHQGNVEAVTTEIERVKRLTVVRGQGPTRNAAYTGLRKASWRNAHRSPARNKGRRTMGRAGGR